ncbi:histone protein [Streptomyces sp. NPDC015350]|uniref:histone protein n=1 Tax=Streptomyces sp. NPDC015350 TaxID=3364955 RepID=UPI0036FDAC85
MTEANKLLLAAAVAGGYVLGRTKKGRLALTAASYLAGRRLGIDPRSLVTQGAKKLGEIPQVADLGDQMRGELMSAGRNAVSAAADRRLSALADSVRERTRRLESAGDEEEDEEEYAPEEDEESEDEGKKSRSRSSRGTTGQSRSRAPKKSSSGRAGGGEAKKSGERKRGTAKKTAPSGKPSAKGRAAGKTAPRKKTASTGKKASSRSEHQR